MGISELQRPGTATSRHALYGLALPSNVLRALQKRGIYCTPGVSLEHQHLAGRYVLRGVESGGAVSDMGRACAFVAEDGSPLPWLQPLHPIAVNRRHAIFLAESMVRLEMLRSMRTLELAITQHTLSLVPNRIRPRVNSKLLFRGRDGVLSVDLWKEKHQGLRGKMAPTFYSRAGEVLPLPEKFEDAIRKITSAACCFGCKHVHLGVPPVVSSRDNCMTSPNLLITVDEPNWTPLERAVPACELHCFMYMGRVGEVGLYKHRLTRHYINIERNSQKFYQYLDGKYVEITKAAALSLVRG
jgi:hypothetical protein